LPRRSRSFSSSSMGIYLQADFCGAWILQSSPVGSISVISDHVYHKRQSVWLIPAQVDSAIAKSGWNWCPTYA
jgi:hypothetical protein